MTSYRVILDVVFGGASVGSTDDTFIATSAAEAEAKAIAAWKQVRPSCSFRPLLTVTCQACTDGPVTRPTTVEKNPGVTRDV